MASCAWGNAREMNLAVAQTILDLKAGKRPEWVVNPEVFESEALRAELF